MSHLVIVDAHAIAHRAYHSIPPLTHSGQPVNAIYGFYSMLLSAIDVLHPSHLAICYDLPGPTFRNTEFLGYRAQRPPADRDLISQLPLVPQTLETAHIPAFSMGGYEADDLIATLARRSLRRRRPTSKKRLIQKVTIITGDKDLMQLVTDQISLFMPIRGLSETALFGPAEVEAKLGVPPTLVIDLKALMGDMSDNYPGVAGIGPKTAVDLLQKYGSLDSVYQHLSDITDSLQAKLISGKDSAYMSQKLATLIDNIPINFTLRSTRFNRQKILGLQSLFADYGFKSLSARLSRRFNLKPTKLKPVTNSAQTSLF